MFENDFVSICTVYWFHFYSKFYGCKVFRTVDEFTFDLSRNKMVRFFFTNNSELNQESSVGVDQETLPMATMTWELIQRSTNVVVSTITVKIFQLVKKSTNWKTKTSSQWCDASVTTISGIASPQSTRKVQTPSETFTSFYKKCAMMNDFRSRAAKNINQRTCISNEHQNFTHVIFKVSNLISPLFLAFWWIGA